MPSDACFRPVSPAVVAKVAADPPLAACLARLQPPFDHTSARFHWPASVRAPWAALVASGGADAAAARAVDGEMRRLTYGPWARPAELQAIAAAGIALDDIPGVHAWCGAGWSDVRRLLAAVAPASPDDPSPDVPTALAGQPLGDPARDDAVRLLTPVEAAAAAAVLAAADDVEVAERHEAAASRESGSPPDEAADARAALLEAFAAIRATYLDARDRGWGLLVWAE